MIVNVNKLNGICNEINGSIGNYEAYIYDTLSSVKNLSFYWNDGYTKSFFNAIDKTQQSINDVVDFLHSLSNVLRTVVSNYSSINYSKGDIGLYGWVNSSDFIINECDEDDIKSKKSYLMNRTSYVEDEISSNVNQVGDITINSVDFNSLDIDKDRKDFVGVQDNMYDEINKIKSKLSKSRIYIDRLSNCLYSVPSAYNSINSKKILAKADMIIDSINRIDSHLNQACNYVESRRNEYKHVFSDLANEIKRV